MQRLRTLAATAMVLVLLLQTGCSIPGSRAPQTKQPEPSTPAGQPKIPEPARTVPVALASFAAYEEVPVSVIPAVKPYQVAGDLSNITNRNMFELSSAAITLLSKNGFVVVPNNHLKEFFWLYEINRYDPVPSFVTTDSMLHNYHLFFNHLLRTVEVEKLIPELKKLNRAALADAEIQYRDLKGTTWEQDSRRTLAFIAIAAQLLDPTSQIPAAVRNEVDKEKALIAKHAGIADSPVMNIGGMMGNVDSAKEDYSQYIPRGHYDASDAMRAYFKAMMWYGRQTFRLKNENEVRSAVLLTLLLSRGDNMATWNRIYEPTCFFVGNSDDISPLQFRRLLDETYGSGVDLKALVSDKTKWSNFMSAAGKLEPPSINSMPIFDESIQPDREKEIKGFRFMGQRFTIDASIMQRLVYRDVKENGKGQRRMLPKGLDLPAAFGSKEAYDILKSIGETDYQRYPENMARIKTYLAKLDSKAWTQNLYWGWMHSLLPLLEEKPAGYPSFMRNSAWARKDIAAMLGSWVELKHDTILYSKPVYAEAGGGNTVDDRGYVEPNPQVYARLAALTKMTREGLKSRSLLNQRDEQSLQRLETLALSLKTIAEKELENKPLSDADYELIRGYGVQLEHFWLEALRDEGVEHRSQSFDHPAAVIADIATDVSGSVLEEATGNVFEIYAVVPVEGKLRIAKGAVYSYYEFTWPLNDRLTDSKWHKMLNEGKVPPMPEWTNAYISK